MEILVQKSLSIPFVNSVPFSGEAFEEVKEKSGEERYNVKLTLSFVDTKFVELGIITENGKHCFTKGVQNDFIHYYIYTFM